MVKFRIVIVNLILILINVFTRANIVLWPTLSEGNLRNRLFNDSFGYHVEIMSYALDDGAYLSVKTNSGCTCRWRCQVKKECHVVSIIRNPEEGMFECRFSGETLLGRSLTYSNTSITYYTPLWKPNGANPQILENWYYDKSHGLIYYYIDMELDKVDAQKNCTQIGGHLPIFQTSSQMKNFHEIAYKYVGNEDIYLLWIDLTVRYINDSRELVWGNGQLYDWKKFSSTKMDFGGEHLKDGYDVRIRGKESGTMGLNGVGAENYFKYKFLCQLDPFQLNGLMYNEGVDYTVQDS